MCVCVCVERFTDTSADVSLRSLDSPAEKRQVGWMQICRVTFVQNRFDGSQSAPGSGLTSPATTVLDKALMIQEKFS